jgi:hypothetical protein
METNEFFYWLQGFFELTGADVPPLSDWQIECIIRHDRLVAAQSGRRGEQMIKIGVMLEAMRDGLIDRPKGTEAVRKMVAHQFQHVIDPQAGDAEQQAKLNAIHDLGHVDPKTGAVYRC